MPAVNRVILVGNVVHTPELKFSPAGIAVCKASLAVNSRVKKGDVYEETVDFFDIVFFGKTGEAVGEYVKKGQPLLVEGRLKQERWEKDGVKRTAVRVHADAVQFLAPRAAEGTAPGAEGMTQ